MKGGQGELCAVQLQIQVLDNDYYDQLFYLKLSTSMLKNNKIIVVQIDLPKIIYGNEKHGERTRIKCLIRSTYTETRMPPALNDILVTHPSPVAVSRFRLAKCHGNVAPSYSPVYKPKEIFSFNVWSSGIWYAVTTYSLVSC